MLGGSVANGWAESGLGVEGLTSKKLRPAEYTSTKTCPGPAIGSGTSVEREILEGWVSSFTTNALIVVGAFKVEVLRVPSRSTLYYQLTYIIRVS